MSTTVNEQPAQEQPTPQAPQQEPTPQAKVFDEAYVKELRDEAASWRTKVRDLEGKLKDAKTPEDVNNIVADYGKQLHQKDVEIVAIKYNIPEALRDRLQGNSPEELEKDAAAIAALFQTQAAPKVPVVPSGGLNPSDADKGDLDPAKLAASLGRSKRLI